MDGIVGGWQLAGIVGGRTGLPVNISLNGISTNPATKQSYRFFSRNGAACGSIVSAIPTPASIQRTTGCTFWTWVRSPCSR